MTRMTAPGRRPDRVPAWSRAPITLRRAGCGRRPAQPAGRCRSRGRQAQLRRAATRPPVASIRPRTTASPMPRPPREPPRRTRSPGRTCRTGAAAPRRGTPGPLSSTSGARTRTASGRVVTRIVASGGRVLDGVVEDVRDRRVEEHGVDPDRARARPRARAAGRRAAGGRGRAACVEQRRRGRRAPGRRAATPASIRLRSSRFATSALRYSTSRSIAWAFAWRSAADSAESVSRLPAAARITASGVRKSWDTDWRSDDLQGIALARDLGCTGLLLDPVPSQRLPDLVRRAAEQPGLHQVRLAERAVADSPRSIPAPLRWPRYGHDRVEAVRDPTRRTRSVDDGPAGPARRPGVRWRIRTRLPAGRGPSRSVSATTRSAEGLWAEPDPHAPHGGLVAQRVAICSSATSVSVARREHARHAEQGAGLPLARDGRHRAGSLRGPRAGRRRSPRTAAGRRSAARPDPR